MPKQETRVAFTPKATTVYLSGSGHPFRPGDAAAVPESHLADLQANDDAAAAKAAQDLAAANAEEQAVEAAQT